MDKQTFCSSQSTSNTARYAAALYRQGTRTGRPGRRGSSRSLEWERSRMGAGTGRLSLAWYPACCSPKAGHPQGPGKL